MMMEGSIDLKVTEAKDEKVEKVKAAVEGFGGKEFSPMDIVEKTKLDYAYVAGWITRRAELGLITRKGRGVYVNEPVAEGEKNPPGRKVNLKEYKKKEKVSDVTPGRVPNRNSVKKAAAKPAPKPVEPNSERQWKFIGEVKGGRFLMLEKNSGELYVLTKVDI